MKIHLDGLRTERLYFVPLTLELLPDLLPFFSSREAMRHMIIPDNPYEFGKEWIERQIKRYRDNGFGLLGLKRNEDDQLIGCCGLIEQEVDGIKELEVGYHLIPKFWRNGYATEAATACRDFAFNQNLSRSVISIIVVSNEPSKRVALRNGMLQEKRTKYLGFDVIIFRCFKEHFQ